MTVVLLAALFVPPLLVLRGRTLAHYLAADLSTWGLAWLLSIQLPALDPRLGVAAVAVAKLFTFAVFLVAGNDVRWSPARGALIAAVVYAAVIPAMLHAPIDGDEPYYLLVTESIVKDLDLDLANQYATPGSSRTGRLDIGPLPGDPTGPGGEQYSRHEPFLSLLMVPGYLLGGLYGAVATIALFGVLLVRSTLRWMEEEGIAEEASRLVFPFFALAPPLLFYATRIWPEVPAAFFFVEALRGMRGRRGRRWIPALAGLVLLKLRFVLVAAAMLARLALERRGSSRRGWLRVAAGTVVLVVPLALMWAISGDATNVHSWRELLPVAPADYLRGLGGLLADGMSGIAFQAPFYLAGIAAALRWRTSPASFRAGLVASALYLFYLLPRGEWFGGWAPPLRYIVFLMPVLALGAASVAERIPRPLLAVAGVWTAALTVHGLAWPWRLFHLFNGENAAGEWLSRLYAADVSRMFPSFVRLNAAAWPGVGVVLVVITWIAFRKVQWRLDAALSAAIAALLIAGAVRAATRPASTVHFEDAHVRHDGGELYPETWTMMRTAFRGGWVLEGGDSVSFLAREGRWTIHAITGLGALVEIDGHAYRIEPDERYQELTVTLERSGRATLRCLSGAVNVDRMDRHE